MLFLYFRLDSEELVERHGNVYMYFLRVSSIRAFGTAPTIWSTRFPFLKISRVGIAMMSNLPEVPGFSSVFNFPNATFPLYSFASPSITGETRRQGHTKAPSSPLVPKDIWKRMIRSLNRQLLQVSQASQS